MKHNLSHYGISPEKLEAVTKILESHKSQQPTQDSVTDKHREFIRDCKKNNLTKIAIYRALRAGFDDWKYKRTATKEIIDTVEV